MTESSYSSFLDTRAPPGYALRRTVASALTAASRVLAHMASRLDVVEVRAASAVIAELAASPSIEFYAEAGAPEGALYANGLLIGYLPVARL